MASYCSWAQLVLVSLLLAGLASVSLGWRPEQEKAAVESAAAETAVPATGEEIFELGVGGDAPDFDLPLIDGGRVVLEEVLQERPVLLVVWAVWCPPCVAEFKELNRLQAKYGDQGLQILAVGVRYEQSLDEVRRFAYDQAVEFPVLYDEREKVVQRYGISYIPTNFLIGRDGVVRFSSYGLPADVDQEIERLLDSA